jgi:cytochrome c-type biogenesis protein CcmH
MIEFGFYALSLLLAALGSIIVPLLLTKSVRCDSDDEANIRLAKLKVEELQAELTAGAIGRQQFEAAKRELEVGLYHELQDNEQRTGGGDGRWLAIPILFIVPVLALGLYAQLGDFRAFDAFGPKAAAQSAQTGPGQLDQVEQMVAGLAQRLEQQPNDLQGWLMLGRSYKATKRFGDAVAALRKAQALQPDNADLLLQLADALAMANQGRLNGEAAALIEQALKLQPDSEMGLWLSGLSLAEQGRYTPAIETWRKLQQHYQPGQSEYREVQELIDTALQRLGRPAEPRTVNPPPVAATVQVDVALAPELAAQVRPDDSVMIYLQAVDGAKMPLAAVKRQAKELPLQIRFDDSMALNPALKLSAVAVLQATARISRSGNAAPQAGEPIGKAKVVGQPQAANVVIDGVVP